MGKAKKLEIDRKHQRWCVALVLLLIACGGVAPEIYRVITTGSIGIWSTRFYNLLNNRVLINISICIFLFIITFRFVRKSIIITDIQDMFAIFNILLLVLLLFEFLLFSYSANLEFANIVWKIDYRELLCFLLLFSLFYIVIGGSRGYKSLMKKSQRTRGELYEELNNQDGFIPENDNISNRVDILEDLNDYAYFVANSIMNTSVLYESFAVGIISEWGRGKTTFLKLLKQRLIDETIVIDFNPWMCSTPQQVTDDFFATLRKKLSIEYDFLSNPILQYARHLNSVTFRFPGLAMKFSTSALEKSLLDRKNELSNRFKLLDKRVIVLIDDIDRLDSSEVFEVLRLIRNTADLRNVIYVVAFDREYVTAILKERHIDNPEAYLEKIFQIEVQLPLVTGDRLIKTLTDEIKKKKIPNVENLNTNFTPEEKSLILKVIKTYRRAKRFARLFMFNYKYLSEKSMHSFDLDWRDLFWLDLLKMHDQETYDHILCDEPTSILKIETSKYYPSGFYLMGEGSDKCQEIKENNPITYELLLKLFGPISELAETVKSANCIRNVIYYEMYFTKRVQSSKEGLEE